MNYRLYFYDFSDKIVAAESFAASDDVEALEIGVMLSRATHDVFGRHEVWCGVRHLAGKATRSDDISMLVEMPEARQARALDLEERLLSSFACIRRSRALLAEVDRLITARSCQAIRTDVDQAEARRLRSGGDKISDKPLWTTPEMRP